MSFGTLAVAGNINAIMMGERLRELDTEFISEEFATCGNGFSQSSFTASGVVVSTVE